MTIPDKTLTDKDLATIITRATDETCLIDDAETYESFLAELATLVTCYFGGDVKGAGYDNGQWKVVFAHNEEVPPGSIFDDFDKEHRWPEE
jgi:hypothetical protein